MDGWVSVCVRVCVREREIVGERECVYPDDGGGRLGLVAGVEGSLSLAAQRAARVGCLFGIVGVRVSEREREKATAAVGLPSGPDSGPDSLTCAIFPRQDIVHSLDKALEGPDATFARHGTIYSTWCWEDLLDLGLEERHRNGRTALAVHTRHGTYEQSSGVARTYRTVRWY